MRGGNLPPWTDTGALAELYPKCHALAVKGQSVANLVLDFPRRTGREFLHGKGHGGQRDAGGRVLIVVGEREHA